MLCYDAEVDLTAPDVVLLARGFDIGSVRVCGMVVEMRGQLEAA